MLIDTHCHINIMVKKDFDRLMTEEELHAAQNIVDQAHARGVTTILNVGTSLVESLNCVSLAKHYPSIYATVGIHPTDCTSTWQNDFAEIKKLVRDKEQNKIVGIGETGIDKYHPNFDLQRQKDAFKAHIELALEHNLALVVHSRSAYDETLYALDEFSKENLRGTIHCFSEDAAFASHAFDLGLVIGIGGTVTYPNNKVVREVARTAPLEKIILETDAPFLPPQALRGKQNHPEHIATVADFLAELRGQTVATIADTTTHTARKVFNLTH